MPRLPKEPFFHPFRPENLLPFLKWIGMVNRETLKDDSVAAFTNAAVVLPLGIAFAAIAGLPPQYGLYTAMITPIITALFGSSWHLISGPTTAISVVIFATLSNIHEPGSAAYIQAVLTITLTAGVFQVLMGLVNLGQLVSLVSHSVMVGFTAGAAILIALTQISGFLGQKLPRPEDTDAFLNTLWRYYQIRTYTCSQSRLALLHQHWRVRNFYRNGQIIWLAFCLVGFSPL